MRGGSRAAVRGGVRAVPLLTVAALLWSGALALQAIREARQPLPPVSSDILYFRGGAAVSRAALGFDAILADIYWIRSIQHFGGTRRAPEGDKTYKLLYPLLVSAEEGSSLRDLVMLLTYGPLLILFLLRLLSLPRIPPSNFEVLIITLYLANALLSAIFFTRIRLRLPFDYLLILNSALMIDRLINFFVAERYV